MQSRAARQRQPLGLQRSGQKKYPGVKALAQMTKRVEQLMRRAEGALGRAFRNLDAAGSIARRLDAECIKLTGGDNFVELIIVREVVDRVGRICNAAFIADARAAGPLPFPPRDPGRVLARGRASGAARTRKRKKS